jgi:hypothetical protein
LNGWIQIPLKFILQPDPNPHSPDTVDRIKVHILLESLDPDPPKVNEEMKHFLSGQVGAFDWLEW